ncbi:MAG TPA: radical SAM protein, partial [bacterium]|nr:radical SAM protein [bacterium]
MKSNMIAFGPVPSRRLGLSLGINNIPAKHCSYSCIYCQVGVTPATEVERKKFYEPEEIFEQVKKRVETLKKQGEKIDYLSFVPDGEPALDLNLGREIMLLRTLKIPVAVITNASLLWREDVREDLKKADWVSVKIATVSQSVWKKMHRPHTELNLDMVLQGIGQFASEYRGCLVTETLLVKGLNDSQTGLLATAKFLRKISPARAYLGFPTRPPAENWVEPPDPTRINLAYQIFLKQSLPVELMGFPAANNFGFSGDAAADLLATTAVHPMEESQVWQFLQKAGADQALVE